MRWPTIRLSSKWFFGSRRKPAKVREAAGEHLSDEWILMDADGELSEFDKRQVHEHLSVCWICRARKLKLERTIGEFVDIHREALDPLVPPVTKPATLLHARLTESVSDPAPHWLPLGAKSSWTLAASCALLVITLYSAFVMRMPLRRTSARTMALVTPNTSLTPGAAVRLTSGQVCQERRENNRIVPVALQRQVFAAYGIVEAEPRAYEVDYLITPALGGADDIHNIWPQTYSAMWNARVKDALEDRLHEMVCAGDLELATAQMEISSDWIAAYKKYFHTEQPIDAPQDSGWP